jgi:hypothetical protein
MPQNREEPIWQRMPGPGWGVLFFALWICFPMWSQHSLLFMGQPAGDNLATPWFYGFVAQEGPSALLHSFDVPRPIGTRSEFPSLWDARLFSPLVERLEWPQWWGIVASACVILNALSMAALARVLGCGGLATLYVGCMGALLRPVWSDIAFGRLNVALPGLAVFAFAFWLWSFPSSGRSWAARGASAGLAGLFGVLAAWVYPPFLLLLSPMALLLAWRLYPHPRGWFLPLLAVGCAYGIAHPELMEILRASQRSLACASECPDIYHRLSADRIFLFSVPDQGLSLSGLSGWMLLSLPLALFRPGLGASVRQGGWLLPLLSVGALYLVLSLGPCPYVTDAQALDLTGWLRSLMAWPWCFSASLHDYARLATPVGLLVIVLGGMALSSLRGRFRWMGAAAAAVIVGLASADRVEELLDPAKWHSPAPSAPAVFLRDRPAAVVAELPFDTTVHYLSALEAPQHRWVNPLRLAGQPRSRQPFFLWLQRLGRGHETGLLPTAQQVSAADVDWVFFDSTRCRNRKGACSALVVEELRTVLGEPSELAAGVWMWEGSE